MSIERMNPEGGLIPPGMSMIVRASGATTLYLTAEAAFDDSGKLVGEGDVVAQANQALANLKKTLALAGATMSDVVKLTYFVVDYTEEMGAKLLPAILLPDDAPALTLVGVSSLPAAGMLIAIDAIAVH